MRRVERQGVVFLLLAAYAGGSIVAAAVSAPETRLEQVALFPGLFYLAAVGSLTEFARVAAVGVEAMNALYAALAYVVWWVGAYLVAVSTLGVDRSEFKAISLALPGVVGVLAGAGALAWAFASAAIPAAGTFSAAAFVGALVGGVALVVLSGVWLSWIRAKRFGWQARALEHADAAVEVSTYLLLLLGLGLLAYAVDSAVGAQYLVLALVGLAIAAAAAAVPDGATGGGTGTEWG